MTWQEYNRDQFIEHVRQLLSDAGLHAAVVNRADVVFGAARMLKGFGVEAVFEPEGITDELGPFDQVQRYNEHQFIRQVEQLLIDEGLEPEMVNYLDVSGGGDRMLRGLGVKSVLELQDVVDRTWPSRREETDSPW
ncbi:hypothetical protein [Glycomyces sp. YM15]|uniref:hypothetical protein n=1 Tax=Glycomyces sp. YM15 TaxID=2800446 RepID=UPI0019645396|nr:hypothetical protein [Glycomyces sp. YM15]